MRSRKTFACRVVFGFAFATLWLAGPAKAQGLPANTVATNFPGVRAFVQSPAGFDASAASPAELESWGYPPRPTPQEGPQALARWLRAVSPSLRRVIPQLARNEGVYHLPAADLEITSAAGKSVNATSENWSGYALVPDAGAKPFDFVAGTWTVPTVKQAPGTCSNGWDYSSHWVGIGGFADDFLLQAGSAGDAYCDNPGDNVTESFPWVEWLPAPELVIYENASENTLYPFAAGDYLVVYVEATKFSGGVSKSGKLYFADVTQGWTLTLTFTAAALGGSKVTGKSAEWIVERTSINGQFATLPDYNADPWVATVAQDLAAKNYDPGAPDTATAYDITMLDNDNRAVSFVDLYGTDALWFFPEGSAVK